MSEAKAQRKTVFIQKGFQARFIAWVIGLLLLCLLFSGGALYPLLTSEVNSKLTSGHIGAEQAGEGLMTAIVIGNLFAIIVAALASAYVFLRISHKIAGPLYRFERVCEEVGRGNFNVSAKLRDADQLKGLSDAFGDMLAQLNQQQTARNERIAEARAGIDALRGVIGDASASEEALSVLDESLANLIEDGGA